MLSSSCTYQRLSRDPAPSLEREIYKSLLKRLGSLPNVLQVDMFWKNSTILSFQNTQSRYSIKTHSFAYQFPNLRSIKILDNHSVSISRKLLFKCEEFFWVFKIHWRALTSKFYKVDVIWCCHLFTKILINRAIEIDLDHFEEDAMFPECTYLSPKAVDKLLSFCPISDAQWKVLPTIGTTIGSPVAATAVNLVMEVVEDNALSTLYTLFHFGKDM